MAGSSSSENSKVSFNQSQNSSETGVVTTGSDATTSRKTDSTRNLTSTSTVAQSSAEKANIAMVLSFSVTISNTIPSLPGQSC